MTPEQKDQIIKLLEECPPFQVHVGAAGPRYVAVTTLRGQDLTRGCLEKLSGNLEKIGEILWEAANE